MDWSQFDATVDRAVHADRIELDLRPFGTAARQIQALEFWLEAALAQGPFGKTPVLKTDANVVLSDAARYLIVQLQVKGVGVKIVQTD
jgi:hypothetical protein